VVSLKDLDVAKKILEMKIRRNRQAGKLFMSDENYIEKVLEWSTLTTHFELLKV
jgi:hypothetical protein